MKHPLFRICLAFCSGILFADYTKITLLTFYIFLIVCVILNVCFRRKIFSQILILLSVFMFGACLLKNVYFLPDTHISKIISYKTKFVYVKGIIKTDPVVNKSKTSFILETEDVLFNKKIYKVSGNILVNAYNRDDFKYGQKVILNGKLYKPFNFDSSDKFNYVDYLKRQGIYYILSVKKNDYVRHFQGNFGSPIKDFAYNLKHKMRDIVLAYLPAGLSSVLNAMVLGERKDVPKYINDALARSGTIHVLAVSGLNTAIVAFIIMVLLKVLRFPRNIRIVMAIILLAIYTVLVGAMPSVVRAAIMISIVLFGYLLQREPDIYNSLSVAALIILIQNPNQIFDIGFQLSFISVFSIVWLSPKIRLLFPSVWFKNRINNFVLTTFCVSLSAWLGTMGLVAYYFRIFSPVTVLANMVLVPVMVFITAVGFTLIIFGSFSVFLATLIAPVCSLLLAVVFQVNFFLINIPYAYFNLWSLKPYPIALYYVTLILFFKYARIPKEEAALT